MVAQTRDRYQVNPGVTFGAAAQDKHLTYLRATLTDDDGVKWLAQGSSVAQQQTVRDFAATRSRALQNRKNQIPLNKRAGMPRFKKRDTALLSIQYSRRGFTLKTDPISGVLRLHLPGGVRISVVWSRPLPSTPSSVRVYRDRIGHWYASFVVEVEHEPLPKIDDGVAIGIDWGVKETATTARINVKNGEIDETTRYDLPHRECGRRAAAELAAAQRQMARRRRPKDQEVSHGYRLAKFKAAKLAKKVARQRKDDARKWARRIVADHDNIAVEDFKPKFLAKSTMARKAADAAIGAVKAELIWQATKAGRDVRLVNPQYTTSDCGACGARTKHRLPLGQRVYVCKSCGHTRSRDKNSAIVMVARAGFIPASVEDKLFS